MAATDLKPGFAIVQVGSRNVLLEAGLARLIKRKLVSIVLKIEPANVLEWIELRRSRDDRPLARLVNLDEDREKLIEIHPDFLDALAHAGLTTRDEDGLVIPVSAGERVAQAVVHALESYLTAGEPAPKGTAAAVWDYLDQMTGSVEAPPDWSAEHDHYLYGTPKRGDDDRG